MFALGAVLAQSTEPTTPVVVQVPDNIWFATLGFGAFALLLVGVVQFATGRNKDKESPTFIPFARTYGLIVIATLAAALTLSSVDLDAKTGAFALLGTIAGYLAATATGVTKEGATGGTGQAVGQGDQKGGGSGAADEGDRSDQGGRGQGSPAQRESII